MYILIRRNYNTLKADIKNKIETGEIDTWKFVIEDERTRLMHITPDKQYEDVLLRFITTHSEGPECLKIVPKVKNNICAEDRQEAENHLGVVLGRFAELLNCHFLEIGAYETILQ